MKKILLTFLSMIVISGASMAQSPAKNTAKVPLKTRTEKDNSQATENVTATPAAKLKSDGTPDKRYKENKKAEVTPAGPTKKDGTPDKRYKANKDASSTPKQ